MPYMSSSQKQLVEKYLPGIDCDKFWELSDLRSILSIARQKKEETEKQRRQAAIAELGLGPGMPVYRNGMSDVQTVSSVCEQSWRVALVGCRGLISPHQLRRADA